MTLDCIGLRNERSGVISFAFFVCRGPGARFFAAQIYSSREMRGRVIRHSRLERNTAREANSLSEW